MDENRFDSLARSIARWTSRRRFVGGLAGAAAGGLLGARQARAQEQEPEPTAVADESVRAEIVRFSEIKNTQLNELKTAIEGYQTAQGGPDVFDPYAFDPRLKQFIPDLITLTERGMGAASWDNDRVLDFLLTINLVVGGISAGGDTDVQLDTYADSQLGGQGTPQAGDDCGGPIRLETCTATCLDVWEVRETKYLASGQMKELIQAFEFFIECWLFFGSIDKTNACLSTLIDMKCALKVICGCAGDCH